MCPLTGSLTVSVFVTKVEQKICRLLMQGNVRGYLVWLSIDVDFTHCFSNYCSFLTSNGTLSRRLWTIRPSLRADFLVLVFVYVEREGLLESYNEFLRASHVASSIITIIKTITKFSNLICYRQVSTVENNQTNFGWDHD